MRQVHHGEFALCRAQLRQRTFRAAEKQCACRGQLHWAARMVHEVSAQ